MTTKDRHLTVVDGRETLGEDRADREPDPASAERRARARDAAATVRQRKKRPADVVAPPEITPQSVAALQRALDEREIVGFKQPLSRGKFCDRIVIADGAERACSGHAAFHVVDEKPCPSCEKMDVEILLQLCVADAAKWAMDELQIDPQLGLFGAPDA